MNEGQFVAYQSSTGEYRLVTDQNMRASHFVLRSGEARVTADEIVNLIGVVQDGEPVMAVTGRGTARLPVASDVLNGQQLTVDNGYLVAWTGGSDASEAFIVGYALEDIEVTTGGTIGWGEVFIDLPAKYTSATTGEV